MPPADPWSGIPDDLRRAVNAFAETWGGFKPNHLAAEAALCAALRALVADRERLDWLEQSKRTLHCSEDDSEAWELGVPWILAPLTPSDVWAEQATPREAIDAARGARP